jgi:hypothetical protein
MPNKVFFLRRLNDHIQYLTKIEATMRGKCDFQGTNHHDCKLGQWLYGDGVNELSTLHNNQAQTIFEALFEPHEQFHTISKQALTKQHAGDELGAKNALTNMYKLSHVLTQKLLQLDKLAQNKT